MPLKSYEDLAIWREGHALVLEVYRLSGAFPGHETFGLRSQFRRAAVSVPANIAEGMGKRTTKELINFLFIARGSVQEVKYYCRLVSDLGYADAKVISDLGKRYAGLDAGLHAFIVHVQQKTAA